MDDIQALLGALVKECPSLLSRHCVDKPLLKFIFPAEFVVN